MKHAHRAFSPIEMKGDDGDANAIVTKALNELGVTMKGRIDAIEAKNAEIEARLNRPITGATNDNVSGAEERKAFDLYARRGAERMHAEELKALTVAVDAAGGYLAPEIFASEILKALVQFSPVRQYARVTTIGASEIKFPKRTGSTTATWVGETAARTPSEPTYGQVSVSPFELATYTDLSTQLLEDNTYNLEGDLAADFAESFGRAEGAAFVSGNGTSAPMGFMTASGVTEVKTGVAATFPTTNPADVIIGMYHTLPNMHAQNGVWAMNRNTLGTIRKWKDTQGRYLIVDPISEGAPLTLLGRPIVEMVDMADIAANAYPIMFGDFSGFRILDRVGLSVLRDPYSLATTGQVRFHARRRTASLLTHPDRFVKLKVSV